MSIETYEDWVKDIQKRIDEPNCLWNRVGIYGFAAKGNDMFNEVIIHYCYSYWLECQKEIPKKDREFDRCTACGEATPDGIKMIALLEKL